MTPEILAQHEFDDVVPIALHYDANDERYVLATQLGGIEARLPFVAVHCDDGRIHLLRRRELGSLASGATLETTPAALGAVGDVLRRIDEGDHPEVATHV